MFCELESELSSFSPLFKLRRCGTCAGSGAYVSLIVACILPAKHWSGASLTVQKCIQFALGTFAIFKLSNYLLVDFNHLE